MTPLKSALSIVVCASALLGAAVAAAAPAPGHPGKQVFDRWCAECHAAGEGHPGTQQLGWTRGPANAVLESRDGLPSNYIRWVVRHGLLEMPPFRPSEIDDAQLEQLAQYLSKEPVR